MKTTSMLTRTIAVGALSVTLGLALRAQQPTPPAQTPQPPQAPARGGGGGAGGGRGQRGGAGAATPTQEPAAPAVPQVSRRPPVDAALVAQGKAIWTRECITCHGTNARGTDTAPNLIRSQVIGYDRGVPALGLGTVLGPFIKKGHPTQSGKPSASFTDQELLALANFLSDKVNETMRGSPTYIVLNENVLTGDAKAGEAFFKGEGGCTQCHNATSRNLAGIGTRITSAQTLQGLVLYPGAAGGRGGGRGGRGFVPTTAEPPAPNPLAITTTITPVGGQPITVTTVEEDSFFITYRDTTGALKTLRKVPGMKIVQNNPMQWHVDFADRITDKQMHDLTAYLWSLK